MSNDKLAERQRFEEWYTTHAHNYSINPIGSRDCALQWDAWEAALQAHAPEAAQAQVQAAEPVAITKDSDDLYTGWLSWTGKELPPGTKLYTHPQPAQDAKECGATPDDPSADAMLDWLSDMDNAAEIGVYGIDDSGDLRQRIVRAMKAKVYEISDAIDSAMAKESGR